MKLVFTVIMILIVSVVGLALTAPKRDYCTDRFSARTSAEMFIGERLKTPATADYSGLDETTVSPLGNCAHQIIGWVDSQNSFGANIRNFYTIIVRYDEAQQKWVSPYYSVAFSNSRADVSKEGESALLSYYLGK